MASPRPLVLLVLAAALLAPAAAHARPAAVTWAASWAYADAAKDKIDIQITAGTGGLACGIVASEAGPGVKFTGVSGPVQLNAQTPIPPSRQFFGFKATPSIAEGMKLVLEAQLSAALAGSAAFSLEAYPDCGSGANSVQVNILQGSATTPTRSCTDEQAKLLRLEAELAAAQREYRQLADDYDRAYETFTELKAVGETNGYRAKDPHFFKLADELLGPINKRLGSVLATITKLKAEVKAAQTALTQCQTTHRVLAAAAADCTQQANALAAAQGTAAGYALVLPPFAQFAAKAAQLEAAAAPLGNAAAVKALLARVRLAATHLASAQAAAAKAKAAVAAASAALAKCRSGG